MYIQSRIWPLISRISRLAFGTYTHTYTYVYIHICIYNLAFGETFPESRVHIHIHILYTYMYIQSRICRLISRISRLAFGTYTHTYTYTYIYIHVCIYNLAFGDSFLESRVHIHIHILYTYMYIQSRIRRLISRISSTHTYTYIYIHICTYNLAFGDSFLETSIRRDLFWNLEILGRCIRRVISRISRFQNDATHCNTLQHTATHNTLQHYSSCHMIMNRPTHRGMSLVTYKGVMSYMTESCHVSTSHVHSWAVHSASHFSNLEIPKKDSPDASLEK